MGPTSTSRNVPYSLSTPQASSGRVPPPSILVRNGIVRSPLWSGARGAPVSYQSRGCQRGNQASEVATMRYSRHWGGERLTLVDDPGRHTRAAVAARRRYEAVHRAARIEEAVAGLEQPIGLAPGLEYQGAFEDIAGLVARVRVIADLRARRQHRRSDHDFLSRHARLIVPFEYGSYRLGGSLRLVRGGLPRQRTHGAQCAMCHFLRK